MSWYEMTQLMKIWIEDNIEEPPPLSEIARRLGYSYFYAAKMFHEVEGVSFREYISGLKIRKAAGDLYRTTDRMIDIAVKYGYSSQEAFTRAFAKVFGVAPAVYRRMQKPTSLAEKSALLGTVGQTKPNLMDGGQDMKLYVKQMYDWNCYAYYAEDVDEQYWDFFKSELWWQLGNSFIKQYDNVKDFKYCAENFTKYGEIAIKQQLKLLPTPWEKALDLLIAELNQLGVDWYIHGSVALALWGIEVKPKDINIMIPNYDDFDKVSHHFCKRAIKPFQRCENWVASGLGTVFMEAVIGFAFHNKSEKPFDMGRLHTVIHNGEPVYVQTLETLKQDNEYYGRPERVKLIEEKIKKASAE